MIVLALLSILGIYRYDDTIFDDFLIPEKLDRELVIDTILFELAELSVIYTEPKFLKFGIGIWSKKRLPIWEKLIETTEYDYNPIYNYDRFEEFSDNESYKKKQDGNENKSNTEEINRTYHLNEEGNDKSDSSFTGVSLSTGNVLVTGAKTEDSTQNTNTVSRKVTEEDLNENGEKNSNVSEIYEESLNNIQDSSKTETRDLTNAGASKSTTESNVKGIESSITTHSSASFNIEPLSEEWRDVVTNDSSTDTTTGVSTSQNSTETGSIEKTGKKTDTSFKEYEKNGSDSETSTLSSEKNSTENSESTTTGSSNLNANENETTKEERADNTNNTETMKYSHQVNREDTDDTNRRLKEETTRNLNEHGTKDTVHSAHLYGNIGVTTTQQMIESEREIVKFDIIDYIVSDFKNKFCIQIY